MKNYNKFTQLVKIDTGKMYQAYKAKLFVFQRLVNMKKFAFIKEFGHPRPINLDD